MCPMRLLGTTHAPSHLPVASSTMAQIESQSDKAYRAHQQTITHVYQ